MCRSSHNSYWGTGKKLGSKHAGESGPLRDFQASAVILGRELDSGITRKGPLNTWDRLATMQVQCVMATPRPSELDSLLWPLLPPTSWYLQSHVGEWLDPGASA